jgi:hypothetical protein
VKPWLPTHPVPHPLISIPALANPDAWPTTSARTHMMTIIPHPLKDRDGRDIETGLLENKQGK